MNNDSDHETQDSTPRAALAPLPNTCRREGEGGGTGPVVLVERRELIPPLPAVGCQPSPEKKTLSVIHPETGECLEFEETGKAGIFEKKYTDVDAQETRRQRFEMKSAAEKVLGRSSRLYKCHRNRIDKSKDVEVKISDESGRAFFSNFQACGSVWLCAVCAPKVTERRKVEVKAGIDAALSQDRKVMLLTGTAPHGMGDDVRVVLAALKKAWKHTSQGRKGHAMRKDTGLVGSIRVLETTYGENGWHPHFHALLILETDLTPQDIEEAWWPLWRDGCVKAGLGQPSRKHGIKVEDGTKAAAYLTKWGIEHELTKGHLKKGKTSCSPWDLLRVMTFGPDHESITSELRQILVTLGIDQDKARALWWVYAKAFKGQRQLYWSNGLRKTLGLGQEKTDQELAEADPEEKASTAATISNRQRYVMNLTRSWSEILTKCETDILGLPELWHELYLEAEKIEAKIFNLRPRKFYFEPVESFDSGKNGKSKK